MRSTVRAALAALALVTVAAVTPAQAQFKLAFVNTAALMEAAPGRAAADSTLQKEGEALSNALKKSQDSLQQAFVNYQKKEPTLSATAKDAEQKKLQAAETEIQARNLKAQQQMSQRQQDLYAPVTERVKAVLEDLRVEGGYSLILANDPGNSPIVAADKNLDITDKVVARLRTVAATDKTKPSTTGPTGVKKPPTQ